MAMKGRTKKTSVNASAGVNSTQGRSRPGVVAFTRLVLLRLKHLCPDILHLLVEVGVRRRIGLRAGEESGLLVEAQRLLLIVGQRRLAVSRHAPVAGRGGEPRLAF